MWWWKVQTQNFSKFKDLQEFEVYVKFLNENIAAVTECNKCDLCSSSYKSENQDLCSNRSK